jgi:hypothetical protein
VRLGYVLHCGGRLGLYGRSGHGETSGRLPPVRFNRSQHRHSPTGYRQEDEQVGRIFYKLFFSVAEPEPQRDAALLPTDPAPSRMPNMDTGDFEKISQTFRYRFFFYSYLQQSQSLETIRER